MAAMNLTIDERLIRPNTPGVTVHKLDWSQLPDGAMLNIDDELAFVTMMFDKYVQANSSAEAPFKELLNRVQVRRQETRLFLGVVGEFSSGKSTLINAFLRDTLLRMDVLQGTTTAATLLYHGSRLNVVIRRKKQNIAVQVAKGISSGVRVLTRLFNTPTEATRKDLLNLIQRATSDESFGQDIVQVNVETPSELLKQGLVIVDTPGVNAKNPRHGMVTVAALRDVCDAVLVVVPAEAAGAQSLFDFLKKHAEDVLFRCVFVVTKIDLIRRHKERERVLNTLRARIQDQLGLPNPRIVACAPNFVVESLSMSVSGGGGNAAGSDSSAAPEGYTHDEIQEWLTQFQGMEKDLEQILLQKRLQAQVDDLAILTVKLFEYLTQLLNDRLAGYKSRHDALQKVVIPNIREFVQQKAQPRLEACRVKQNKIIQKFAQGYGASITSIMSELSTAIRNAESQSDLQTVMESKIPSIYKSAQYTLQKNLDKAMKELTGAAQDELKTFHADFQKHFQDLATLGGTLTVDKHDTVALTQNFGKRNEIANDAIASELRTLQNDQTNTTLGMAASGAVIGTFLFPGVGTLIGGALGGLFSLFFGPSLDDLKQSCWAKLHPSMSEAFREFADVADNTLEGVGATTHSELMKRIQSYQSRYEGLVDKMRERDASEKAQLQTFRVQIESELALIQARRTQVEQAREQLRQL